MLFYNVYIRLEDFIMEGNTYNYLITILFQKNKMEVSLHECLKQVLMRNKVIFYINFLT